MLRFAVIGNPVKHSLSPHIHHFFAQKLGVELIYRKIETLSFNEACNNFFLNGGSGLNVTVPFKQQAFELASYHTPRCKRAKAANTLWLDNQGQLCADNTDGIGIVRDLEKYTPITDKSILIIGAGGASRGIIPALKQQQPSCISIVNRNFDKALKLAKEFEIEALPIDDDLLHYDILINSTSASLDYKLPGIKVTHLASDVIAYDCVYQSEPTVFMVWAKQSGANTSLDGLGMLVEQAAESFSVWMGASPDSEIKKSIQQQLRLNL